MSVVQTYNFLSNVVSPAQKRCDRLSTSFAGKSCNFCCLQFRSTSLGLRAEESRSQKYLNLLNQWQSWKKMCTNSCKAESVVFFGFLNWLRKYRNGIK